MAQPAPPVLTLEEAIEFNAQDANGDDTYSNEKALFGYINPSEYLVLPTGYVPRSMPTDDIKPLGKQNSYLRFVADHPDQIAHRIAHPYITATPQLIRIKIVLLNYINLRATITSPAEAFYGAQLRSRWLQRGFLYPNLADRKVTYDEVRFANRNIVIENEIDTCAAMQAIKALATNHALIKEALDIAVTAEGVRLTKHCVKYAETWWSIIEFLMRTKGHHWKELYAEVVMKAYTSVSEGNVDFNQPSFLSTVMRVAPHPFGLKALVWGTYNSIAYGKIGNGLILRLSGAPNGFAAITTAAAGLAMIRSEQWYKKFEAIYSDNIRLVEAMALQMMDDKYAYHLSASLYGTAPKRTININGADIDMARADMAVTAIAGVIQGFIIWSRGKNDGKMVFSFGNAKSLEKRCQVNPTMVQKMIQLLDYSMEAIEDSASIEDAANGVFTNFAQAAPLAIQNAPAAPVV